MSADADRGQLNIALVLIVGFMLTDAVTIGLSVLAIRLAAKPAEGRHVWVRACPRTGRSETGIAQLRQSILRD